MEKKYISGNLNITEKPLFIVNLPLRDKRYRNLDMSLFAVLYNFFEQQNANTVVEHH